MGDEKENILSNVSMATTTITLEAKESNQIWERLNLTLRVKRWVETFLEQRTWKKKKI